MGKGMRVRKDDQVIVITGKDKGKTGRVLRTEPGAPARVRRAPQHRQEANRPSSVKDTQKAQVGRDHRPGGPDRRLQRDVARADRQQADPGRLRAATDGGRRERSRSGPARRSSDHGSNGDGSSDERAAGKAAPPPRLRERYEAELVGELTRGSGTRAGCRCRGFVKITVNMGVGDAKQSTPTLEAATEQLATITGQHPNIRRARKSIATFKLREGMPVGVSVTLRGARMWEFLDRLISISIPRIRDFRGLNPRSFDGRGNYSIGVREQLIFPEIDYDSIDKTRGLDVTITTSAATDEEGFELLLGLGMPFPQEGRPGRSTQRQRTRRSAARRRPASGPRPRRQRSSSSRKRTPMHTRSRVSEEEEGEEGEEGAEGGEEASESDEDSELQGACMAKTSQRVATAAQAQVPQPRVQPLPPVRPSRAYYRKFGLCRICLREAAHQGYVPGMTKASW